MNDVAIELGKFCYEYQMARKGDVHPKEFIEGLKSTLNSFEYDYGKNGEKASKKSCCNSYYCECNK